MNYLKVYFYVNALIYLYVLYKVVNSIVLLL